MHRSGNPLNPPGSVSTSGTREGSSAIIASISANAIVSRQVRLIEAEVDDELLGMNLDSGICYGMNPTASLIWQKLETPMTFGDLVGSLVEEFDVPQQQCATETTALLQELSDDGLVCITMPDAP